MASNEAVSKLNIVLADAIVFYQKLHQYHWVVSGKQFFGLHAKFEELYEQWADIVDEVAERVLAIGGKPVGTLAASLEISTIQEDGSEPETVDMVKNILADLESQQSAMCQVIKVAELVGDRGSANLMDGYCDSIEKTCWMLRAFLA